MGSKVKGTTKYRLTLVTLVLYSEATADLLPITGTVLSLQAESWVSDALLSGHPNADKEGSVGALLACVCAYADKEGSVGALWPVCASPWGGCEPHGLVMPLKWGLMSQTGTLDSSWGKWRPFLIRSTASQHIGQSLSRLYLGPTTEESSKSLWKKDNTAMLFLKDQQGFILLQIFFVWRISKTRQSLQLKKWITQLNRCVMHSYENHLKGDFCCHPL